MGQKTSRVLACCVQGGAFLCLVVPFYVVAIVLGAVWRETCHSDPVDLGDWLIVLGTVGLGVNLIVLMINCFALCLPCVVIIMILMKGYMIAWIVVGGVALFTDPSSSSCYHHGDDPEQVWIAAVVFWSLSIAALFLSACADCCSVCSSRRSKKDDD